MGSPHRDPAYTLSSKGKQDGPFTEAELILMAREGRIRASDRIRAEGSTRWLRASRVPWLSDKDGQPLKETGTPVWIQVFALVLIVTGLLVVLAIQRNAERAVETIDLGVVLAPAPNPNLSILTEAWGVVPPSRINVRFHGGASRSGVERVAAAIEGEIVGELPLLDLYVLDFTSETERDLQNALALAQTQSGVRSAFPEQIAFLSGDGRERALADDPAYAEGRDRSLEMIGVQTAWNLLRASGVRLLPVEVGIVDSGLYVGQGAFDGGPRIVTPGLTDRLIEPQRDRSGKPLVYASHGTGVASVLAADAADGGVVGVASILGDRLTLRSANTFHDGFRAHPATDHKPLGAYAIASLARIQRQIEDGARVINLSWCLGVDAHTGGFRGVHVGIYRAYRDFFRKMGRRHPDVVFVCSAGNQGGTPMDEGFLPGGLHLPNVVTVANLDGQGRARPTGTNHMAPGRIFHVDLAAPGQGVVYGVGPDGTVAAGDGGTSMAVPLVAATIAILKAVEPELDGAGIKRILRASARTEVPRADGTTQAVPEEVGGRCLAVDLAVLAVLNRWRAALGETEKIDPASLLELTRIDLASARQDAEEEERWVVTASVPKTSQSTTSLTIEAGENTVIEGAETVTVTAGQVVTWTVTPGARRRVEVVRGDTAARWIVELAD